MASSTQTIKKVRCLGETEMDGARSFLMLEREEYIFFRTAFNKIYLPDDNQKSEVFQLSLAWGLIASRGCVLPVL